MDPAPEETTTKRPLGVTLVAAFFFLKGAALLLALGMWQMSRAMLPTAKALAIVAAPVTAQFGLKNVMTAAAVIAVLELTFGSGIWFLARWAWGYTIVMYAAAAVALILVLLVGYADPSFLSLIPHSGYFPVHFVIRIIIIFYLLRPDVKEAFGGNRQVDAGDLVL